MRPILELGSTLGSFITDIKVRKQHASRVRRDKDQDVPKAVQIREVHPGPCVAEHPIIDPANDGQHQDGGVSHSQPVHALILDAKKIKLDFFEYKPPNPAKLTSEAPCTEDTWRG